MNGNASTAIGLLQLNTDVAFINAHVRKRLQILQSVVLLRAAAAILGGNSGHYSPDCYATRHKNGYDLD